MTKLLVFESQSSLSCYIKNTLKYKGEVSLPCMKKGFYQEEKEITHLINLGNRVANSNNYDQSFKRRSTQLKNETCESMQQIIYVLGQKLKNIDSELQNTHKKLYRSRKKALTLQELLEKESNSSSENKDENDSNSNDKIQEPKTKEQKFQVLIQFFISKGRLESTCEEIIAKKKDILEVGFDCAWSKVREAPQASAEFVYNGTPEVTPTLYEYNITLDVGVDGDLNTNKTLCEEKIIHKIFADLKHKSKILRNKIVIINLELQMYNYYSREIGVRASLLSTNSLLDWSKTSRGVFVIVGGSIFGEFGNASECLEALDGIQYSLWSNVKDLMNLSGSSSGDSVLVTTLCKVRRSFLCHIREECRRDGHILLVQPSISSFVDNFTAVNASQTSTRGLTKADNGLGRRIEISTSGSFRG
ncbi:hypothetical protein C2G38_2177474 [Gigaspora rosea]|uniref:Uncharacterized protein n=1 Tax=Gigaspora rosea TaxID=44941 RepID=A0A397VH41_9GLOM|nr:hypothetical protein C2G38_2177474 [Gigaspora rosea]